MTKLKECPFCGSEAKIHKVKQNWDSDYFEGSHFIIACHGKDCEVAPELKSREAKFSQEPDEEEVIKEWNSRAIEDTLTEQNKQLVEALENISEYVDCIPLHFDSGMSQHSKMHIQHFVNQIKAHAVRGLAKHKEQI